MGQIRSRLARRVFRGRVRLGRLARRTDRLGRGQGHAFFYHSLVTSFDRKRDCSR
jgi:hypothetical protein